MLPHAPSFRFAPHTAALSPAVLTAPSSLPWLSSLLSRSSARATLLYALNLALSYLLMLAVMTYNVGVFLVVVGGLAAGKHLTAQRALRATAAAPPEAQPSERSALLNSGTSTSDACCVQTEQ